LTESEAPKGDKMPLLKVENLKIYFHMPRGNVKAVDGVDIEIDEGEIVGVAGESGSGKSTLALGIMRLIVPPGFIEGATYTLRARRFFTSLRRSSTLSTGGRG